MSFMFIDNGRRWHLWTDANGAVHKDPLDPPAAPTPLEPSEDVTNG